MRQIRTLAIINGIVAAAALITLAAMTETRDLVTPQMIVNASEGTDPAFGLNSLSRNVTYWHHRAYLYSGLCYILLLFLAANSLYLAVWQTRKPAR